MTEKEKIRIQTSETFLLSAILALSGGFQDMEVENPNARKGDAE